MNTRSSRIVAAMTALSIVCAPAMATASPEEAVQTYREFLKVRDNADSIQDLYPFMLSRQVDQLKEMPEETVESMAQSVLNPPNA